jgi:hypothetical protein
MPEHLWGRGEILGGSGGKEGGNQAPERPAAGASGSCTRLTKLGTSTRDSSFASKFSPPSSRQEFANYRA